MRLRLLAAFCCLAVLFTTTATQAQTLRIALREDPDILDPTLAGTYVGRIVFAGLCDKLFDIDEHLQIVPQLALKYEWSDPKTLVIHLRPNVTFQNGEPVDAAAVKYTMEHYLTFPGSYRRGEISMIDHVDVVDPLTAKLVLKSPSSPLLSILTDRAGMILPPKATEAAGKDFGLHPVCSGPFKFTERVAQDHITLDRYPGYWDNANIHFDRVIYQPMSDPAVELANLHTGNIALAERVLPSDVDEVKKDPKLRIVTSPALGYVSIIFNVANGDRAKVPTGQSAPLRQAFELAIDRQALVQVVYNGLYQPTEQAVTPASPLYVKGFDPGPRDIDKAKALVKQSGIPTPIPVTFMVPNVPDQIQLAEVIQSMVRDAGFEVKINPVDTAASLSAGQQGNFETYTIGWSGRPDPDGNLYVFLHSGINQNYGHYSSPIVDAALDAARTVSDPTARLAEYAKMMEQLRKDMPVIYLYHPVNIVGMQAKLSGFRPVPDGLIRLQGLAEAK
jgi:peptide/nickel transport system substrate-binding protein